MGTMQIDSIGVILFKNQSERGTAETDLDDGDVAEVENPSVSVDYRVKQIDLMGSKQNQSIIGPRECTVSMAYPLRTGNAQDSQGQIEAALLSAFLTTTESSDTYPYIDTIKDSEWKDSTLWVYSGSQDTSLSLLTKIQNVMFGAKFVLDFNEAYAALQLEGKGVLVAAPALDTQPSITPSTVVTPALINATVSFFSDSDYIPLSMEFDLGPDITATLKPTVASGLGITAPGSKRKIKWTAKVYHDSGVNPHTPLLEGTLGTISVTWGTAPNRFTIATTKAQIESVKQSSQDNVTCFELSGICVDNDFTFTIDTSPTANLTVTYDGNENTGGTEPTDSSSPYYNNETVTVLGNTGSLVKTGSTFYGWNTAADGSGNAYDPDDEFLITESTTLYARWVLDA